MKKSVAKNYLYNLFYQMLVLILPVLTTPYVSRVLGAEGIGIYSYTISITTYFILFGSLGIAMYAQREIAYVQENPHKRSKIFWELTILKFVTLTISLLLFYFTYARQGAYSMYYKILILEIVANALDISFFFQGMEEFKKIVVRNLIVKIISVLSIFFFVKTANDVGIYLFIYVLSTFLGNLSLWFYLPKYLEKVSWKEFAFKKHWKPILILFLPQIATQVYTVLDKTMIGTIILDKKEVGYYEQSQKIVKLLLTILTSLGAVMLPRIANKFAKGKKDEIKKDIVHSFQFVSFLGFPMMFGLMAIADSFIPLFLGEGYETSILIIRVISPILILIGYSNVIGTQFLLPTKQQKEFTISVVAGAILNFLLNMWLIPKYMGIGASIATVVAEMTVTMVQLYFIRKLFSIKKLFLLAKNYFLAGFLMFVVTSLVGFLQISKVFLLAIQLVVGIFSYIGCLFLFKDGYISVLKDKVLKIIHRGV